LKNVALRWRQSTMKIGRPECSVMSRRKRSIRSGLLVYTSIAVTSPERLK
jgi:hypothetical protein